MMTYHTTVLLHEGVEALDVKSDGVYVDVTYGGGGHSKLILEKLSENGRLLAFDQDPDADQNVVDDSRLILCQANFKYLKQFLDFHGFESVDGVLADLGVSGYQFDKAERGFSFRFDAELDMRMNVNQSFSAKNLLNEYSEAEIIRVLKEYGEFKQARRLSQEIVKHREQKPFETIQDLLDAVSKVVPEFKRSAELPKVFQAIRIEVNAELEALKEMLVQSADRLAQGGKLVVISYHSLEDRIVKRFMRSGNFSDTLDKDVFGNVSRPLEPVSGKATVPSDKEIEMNPRARSAKMRVAIKQ